jgi:hypothetical protein
MFVIPCKYVKGQSQILKCVESISKHHPEEKIVIVDSFSDDVSYIEDIIKIPNVLVLDEQNKNYVIGALWKAYDAFPDEHHYVLIHDSMFINKPLTKFLEDDQSYSFMYFVQTPEPSHQPIIDRFVGPGYAHTPGNPMVGIFGTTCIIKDNLIKQFVKNNVHQTFLPINKEEDQASERAMGVLFSLEGVDFIENSVEHRDVLNYPYAEEHNCEYITKIIKRRQ